MSDRETFDFVVGGAGSAGYVLANRLTEDRSATVSLLKAVNAHIRRAAQTE